MATQQDLVNALRQADAAGDTAGAQRIAAMIKASAPPQNANNAVAGEPDLGSNVANSVLAGGLHFVHQLPFVGDAALTAARLAANQANGEGGGWQNANNDVHTILDSAQSGHPVSSTIGGVAGGIDAGIIGGGAVGGGLKAVGAERAAQALTLARGQTVANAGRLALAGGVSGAAQGGGEQLAGGHLDQAIPAAVSGGALGAVAGIAGGAVAPVLGRLALAGARRVLPGMMKPLDAQAARALGKVFNESPSDLQATWQQHTDATGRPPSMAELANYKQQGVIGGLARDSASISDRLNQQAAAAAQQRSANMQAAFEQDAQGRPTAASPGDFTNARTAQGDVDYTASRAAPDFNISTTDDPALGGISPADHIAAEVVPQAGLGRADRVRILSGLQSGTLSSQDAQLLRSGLSESLNRSYSPALKGSLTDLDSFLSAPGNEAPNAALGTARTNFAANSQRVEGATHGASILSGGTPNDFAATAGAKGNTSDFATGMQAGANDALSNAASTPAGATRLAGRLATDSSLKDKLTTVFDPSTAARLKDMGEAEANSAAALTPHSGAPTADKNTNDLRSTAQLFAAVATHGLGWKAYHLAQFVTGSHMSPAVQDKVAQYLSDPKMVPQGINILRKSGVTEQQLRALAMAGAASAGASVGDAASNTLTPQEQAP